MRISDWSSDVCSSDLLPARRSARAYDAPPRGRARRQHDPRDARRRSARARLGGNLSLLALCKLYQRPPARRDRKSVVEGKRVSVRVDLGGGRIFKKKKTI